MARGRDLLERLRGEEQKLLRELEECRADISEISGEETGPGVTSLADFMSERLTDFEWLIGGSIAAGSVGMLVADPGIGKAQPLDARVLTPGGWRRIGDIRVGDEVIGGSHGGAVRVTGVFPRGIQPIYEVSLRDGHKVRCAGDHLWLARKRTPGGRDGAWAVYRTDEMEELQWVGGKRPWSIPFCPPVTFAETGSELPLHPYLLGVYLADGTSGTSVVIHDGDEDVLERCLATLPREDAGSPHSVRGLYVKRRVRRKVGGSETSMALSRLGLHGLRSWEKFIPEQYLLAPADDRLELLRGLLDTDGYVGSHNIEFSSASKALTDGVVFLAMSLGLRATAARGSKSGYVSKLTGKRVECLTRYRTSILVPDGVGIVPVSSTAAMGRFRKLAASERKNSVGRNVYTIERNGEAECVCISVDDPGGLYVTDGFAVTHNTTCLVQIALCLAAGRDPFDNAHVARAVPVLYLAAEGSRAAFQNRVRTAANSLAIPNSVNWYVQDKGVSSFNVASPEFESMVRRSKAGMAILDTIGYFWKGDENSAVEWKAGIMVPLRKLVGKYGTTFLLVHHQVKASQDRKGWQKGRGTSAMFADLDFYLRMEPVEGDVTCARRTLYQDKNKYGVTQRWDLTFDAHSARFR